MSTEECKLLISHYYFLHAIKSNSLKKIEDPKEGKKIKLTTTVNDLCKNLPVEFTMYINYCRGLRFDEDPDYEYLRRLFQGLFDRKKFKRDFIFDWMLLE